MDGTYIEVCLAIAILLKLLLGLDDGRMPDTAYFHGVHFAGSFLGSVFDVDDLVIVVVDVFLKAYFAWQHVLVLVLASCGSDSGTYGQHDNKEVE